MPLRFTRALLVAAGAIAVMATLASAHEAGPAAPPRVRGATVDAALLLDELVARSPTVRDLVGRLNHSDLLVYIRHQWFSTAALRGRIGFLTADSRRRLLAIEISSRYTRTDQLVALAHELQHAMEMAGAPSVWDAPSLAAFYTVVGVQTGSTSSSETYETIAADDIGRRVRNELATIAAPAVLAADDRN